VRLAYTLSMDTPTLLALDTSTERMSLALVRGTAAHARTCDEAGAARASSRLVPAALELLDAARLSLRDVDAFAFGRGPGAFTGLRSACAVAQGFAFGTGRTVLGIDSLLLVAEDARVQLGIEALSSIWVAIDARMGEVYAARYARSAGRWTTTRAPALYTVGALNALWLEDPPATVAGNALTTFAGRLQVGAADRVDNVASRASALARLALEAWHAGLCGRPEDALPLYLRDKVALTIAERNAGAHV